MVQVLPLSTVRAPSLEESQACSADNVVCCFGDRPTVDRSRFPVIVMGGNGSQLGTNLTVPLHRLNCSNLPLTETHTARADGGLAKSLSWDAPTSEQHIESDLPTNHSPLRTATAAGLCSTGSTCLLCGPTCSERVSVWAIAFFQSGDQGGSQTQLTCPNST